MSSSLQPRVAAFFDLDGTLISKPSLESRFFAWLRRHRAIPLANYAAWLAQAARLVPQGLGAMRHANKAYLRGISYQELIAQAKNGSASMAPPSFLPDALHRLTWHAHRNHSIFLVTGTLEPLACEVAQALTALFAIRGVPLSLGVRGTRLTQLDGHWTGHVDGAPMFGWTKAAAIHNLAREMQLDLSRSFAYADSFTDRFMLAAVGNPSAVNPAPKLRRLADLRAWPILSWPPARKSLPSVEPATDPCSSGLQFRREAFRQHEQDPSPGKYA